MTLTGVLYLIFKLEYNLVKRLRFFYANLASVNFAGIYKGKVALVQYYGGIIIRRRAKLVIIFDVKRLCYLAVASFPVINSLTTLYHIVNVDISSVIFIWAILDFICNDRLNAGEKLVAVDFNLAVVNPAKLANPLLGFTEKRN